MRSVWLDLGKILLETDAQAQLPQKNNVQLPLTTFLYKKSSCFLPFLYILSKVCLKGSHFWCILDAKHGKISFQHTDIMEVIRKLAPTLVQLVQTCTGETLSFLITFTSDFWATSSAGLPMVPLSNMTAAVSYACTTTRGEKIQLPLWNGMSLFLPSGWKARCCGA